MCPPELGTSAAVGATRWVARELTSKQNYLSLLPYGHFFCKLEPYQFAFKQVREIL